MVDLKKGCPVDLTTRLASGEFGVLDIGCSTGKSIGFAERTFGMKAAGIDIDPAKVAKARASGHQAWLHDLFDEALPPGCVSYAMLFHVLEHLDARETALKLVRRAVSCARDAVLIRTPNFDLDGLLARGGLKFYFADWSGHKFHVTTLDYVKIINQLRSEGVISGARIYGSQRKRGAIHDLVALDAPADCQRPLPGSSAPVNVDDLPFVVHAETTVILTLGERGARDLVNIETALNVGPADCHVDLARSLAAVA